MFDYIAWSWCRFVDFCLIGFDRRLFYYDSWRLILSAALWYELELGVTLRARLSACIFHLWPKSGITLVSHCVPPQDVPLYSPYLKGYRCNPKRLRCAMRLKRRAPLRIVVPPLCHFTAFQ